ncbi:MAG TPA: signal peptide peptidase SppA [Polyangia bacterium]
MTKDSRLRLRPRSSAGIAWAIVITVAAVVATGGRAQAQAQKSTDALIGYRATQGVYIPGSGVAGDADASGVELNPAQLGLLNGSSLVLAGDASSTDAPLPGRGVGLLLAAPVVFRSALGIGLSGVARTDALGIDSHTKLQISYALRLGGGFALGVDYAHLYSGYYSGLNTFDAGVSMRPGPHLALGVTVRDLSAPTANNQAILQRQWIAELALRPIGTDRFELALGSGHTEDDPWKGVLARVRLAARITDGLRLFADFESIPGNADHVFASGGYYRGSAGFWIDLDHVGAALAMRSGRPGVGDSGSGAAVAVRVSGDRYPALFAPRKIERINLDGVDSDRGYLQVVRALRAAANDDSVAGVLLKIENLQIGWGRIEEVRELVGALRGRGKLVYAYATFPATRDYYLASACNGIIVHPAGEVSLRGLGQTVTFYKGLIDRVGVNVDLVRIAEYKGAMEPFVMNEQSAPVRENKNQLLDDIYGRVLKAVVTGRAARGMTDDKVRAVVDRGSLDPLDAQRAGLIDAVSDENTLDDALAVLSGWRGLHVSDPDRSPQRPQRWGGRRVAVVLVDGTIADGPSQDYPLGLGDVSGSDTLIAALDECRRDSGVGAVVLRVNSPGGSAFASDVIARAVQQLRKAGKPVVVSMGDVAASGGYYIAAGADTILAESSTVTGSIGIFAYKVDVKKLAATLGVSFESYLRGRYADLMSPYRPWTPDEMKLAAERIKHFYELFVDTVVQGRSARGLNAAGVDAIGRGHVWTGSQALALGLVDTIGGLGAAIDQATRLGRVPIGRGGFAELTVLPRPLPGTLQKLTGLNVEAEVEDAPVTAPPAATPADFSTRLLRDVGRAPLRLLLPLLAGNGAGIEARLPYDIEIR